MTDNASQQHDFASRVREQLERIRPMLQADGGDVELVSADESTGKVSVRFQGACAGCPYRTMTLQHGIERRLKDNIPQVTEVVAV